MRDTAVDLLVLIAAACLAYAAAATGVALVDGSVTVGFWAPAAAVGASFALGRWAASTEESQEPARLGGTALSVVAFYAILRLDIVGDLALWDLAWLASLVRGEAEAGAVAETVVLLGVWLWGVARGGRPPEAHELATEAGAGFVALVGIAALGAGSEAPAAALWMPIPYAACALLALGLQRGGGVESRAGGSQSWLLWAGGVVLVAAVIAALAALAGPSFASLGDALLWVVRGLLIAVAIVLSPLIFALAFILEGVMNLLNFEGLREMEPRQQEPPAERDPASGEGTWVTVLEYATRGGVILLATAIALGLLWFAFRRLTRKRRSAGEEREEFLPDEREGGFWTVISGALGRLRPGSALRGRDAIGRLYLAVLREAEARGLPRPPSATPNEFAPALASQFASHVPEEISLAYSEARYGGRAPDEERIEAMRREWEALVSRDRR